MNESSSSNQTIRISVTQLSFTETSLSVRRDPGEALRQTQRLIESELDRLPRESRGPVACRAGCDFCCHLRVMATPIEVFALLDDLFRTLSPEAFTRFEERLIATDQKLRKLKSANVLTVKLPCPALVDGRCTGYAARPLNCRSYHSLSKQACEASFNNPGDLSLDHPQLAAVANVHEGGQAGFMAAFAHAGYDDRQYELTTALAEALDDPESRERFYRKEPAFVRPTIV
ncbi:MAG: YkgJ family cysteine cluster protein [Wenzhouxiangella sp.]